METNWDLLIENHFDKKDTLDMDMLVEMVEDLMSEQNNPLIKIADEIVAILQAEKDGEGGFTDEPVALDAEIDDVISAKGAKVKKTPTTGTIEITNTGNRDMRSSLYDKLSNHGYIVVKGERGGNGSRAAVKKGDISFTLDFFQGSTEATISNIGNFAEGVMAYAMAAKAIRYKEGYDKSKKGDAGYPTKEPSPITAAEAVALANELNGSEGWDNIEPAKIKKRIRRKGKEDKIVLVDSQKRSIREKIIELDDGDKIRLKIALDNVTWQDLDDTTKWKYATGTVSSAIKFANSKFATRYMNQSMDGKPGDTLHIVADGTGDQAGTTADLEIYMTNSEGDYEVGLQTGKISLKTKNTKQLDQAGRKDLKKLQGFFKDLYDYDFTKQDIEDFKDPKTQLFGTGGFFDNLYDQVKKSVEGMEETQRATLLSKVSQMVRKTAGGENITLVKLEDDDFTVYDLAGDIAEEYDIELDIRTGPSVSAGIKYLDTSIVGKKGSDLEGEKIHLLTMRPRRDGSGFRFYIEQGKDYSAFYRYKRDELEKEKEEAEQKGLTNPPQ